MQIPTCSYDARPLAEHFDVSVQKMGGDLPDQVAAADRLVPGREPTAEESSILVDYARSYGLANTCPLILYTNEFPFVD